MATTFRSDVVAAIRTVLLAQQTADPTSLRAVYNSRPGSFPETPCAYIGNRDETIRYGGQLRTRTFNGLTVVLVDRLVDASETGDRMDDLVDALIERFTAAYAAVPGGGSLLQLTSVSDADITLVADGTAANVNYRGAILGFGDPSNPTFITEGRA
jgi:hypothetical protein